MSVGLSGLPTASAGPTQTSAGQLRVGILQKVCTVLVDPKQARLALNVNRCHSEGASSPYAITLSLYLTYSYGLARIRINRYVVSQRDFLKCEPQKTGQI